MEIVNRVSAFQNYQNFSDVTAERPKSSSENGESIKIKLCDCVSVMASVAARLRSLRTDDPSSKGHPRSIKQELETWKYFKLIYELLDS